MHGDTFIKSSSYIVLHLHIRVIGRCYMRKRCKTASFQVKDRHGSRAEDLSTPHKSGVWRGLEVIYFTAHGAGGATNLRTRARNAHGRQTDHPYRRDALPHEATHRRDKTAGDAAPSPPQSYETRRVAIVSTETTRAGDGHRFARRSWNELGRTSGN
jgi:hypothetical protein